MTISELILYFLLFSIGPKCVHNTSKFHQQFDNYYPLMSQGQGDVQIEPLTGSSKEQEMPSTINPWTWNTMVPSSTLATSTTQHFRYLPHSYKRSRTTTTTTPLPTTSRRSHRKFNRLYEDTADSIADKSKDLLKDRDNVIEHISMNLQQYFLRAVVQDFVSLMKKTVKENDVLLTASESAAVENQCKTCSVPELHSILNVLLTIMEKYPELSSEKSLSGHVASEYERASDYLTRKLDQMQSEMATLNYDSEFRDLQRRYARRERNGGIMSLLLEWFETYLRDSHDNVEAIQQKLMKYLTTQKRYWLISIRGVL